MRILIADDHGLFRDGVCSLLAQYDAFEIECAASLAETEALLKRYDDISLLMIDLKMPGMAGASTVRTLVSRRPGLKVLVVSANESPEMMRRCIQAGAVGYLLKSAAAEKMIQAVRQVLGGGSWVPRQALDAASVTLSVRQEQILAHLAQGHSNRDIAVSLGLREGTVKQYVSELLYVLNVGNRTQAGFRAREILGMDG